MTNASSANSYTKLRDGSWGVRSTETLAAGQSIVVTKRDGSSKTETIGVVVSAGAGYSIATIAHVARPAVGLPAGLAPGQSYRRACRTGGDCSSMGSGRNCGGYDCDGY